MIIVEVQQSDKDIIDDIITSVPNEGVIKVDSLGSNDIIQILIPLVSITVPVFSQLLQKYMDNQRVTIKYDGVEISAKSAEQAMKLLEKLKERKAEIAEKADAGEN
ncbi:MAG: hypothetical protein K2O15_10760 [Lachnospiraceae bacterium]|nr:hypothetical protein [Lachnospiraceae bacterium]